VTTWVATPSSRSLSGRRGRDTAPEMALRRALHARGARFSTHRQLAKGCRPDILMRRHGLAVFVDGDFWHGCPVHDRSKVISGPNAQLWREKIERNRQRDARAALTASSLGWRVIRLWECEIMSDPDAVATAVLRRSKLAGQTSLG